MIAALVALALLAEPQPQPRDAREAPEVVVKALQLRPGMVVVDIGAGDGFLEPHLAKAVASGEQGLVLALDTRYEVVDAIRAQRIPHVEPLLVGPESPALPPRSVDRVVIIDTWHHIGWRERYAKRIREILKPGGFVLIVDWTVASPRGPPPEVRDPVKILRELKAGGLVVSLIPIGLSEQFAVKGVRP